MRYWICRTPGKVEGPFERSALESMMSSGELTEDDQVCPEGSEVWQTFASLIESDAGAEVEERRLGRGGVDRRLGRAPTAPLASGRGCERRRCGRTGGRRA